MLEGLLGHELVILIISEKESRHDLNYYSPGQVKKNREDLKGGVFRGGSCAALAVHARSILALAFSSLSWDWVSGEAPRGFFC